MEIQFRRTGERHYAMTIHQKNLPPFEMDGPAKNCFAKVVATMDRNPNARHTFASTNG